MEFLGDAILQLVTSVYVYDTFPLHHEGHLSVSDTIYWFILAVKNFHENTLKFLSGKNISANNPHSQN